MNQPPVKLRITTDQTRDAARVPVTVSRWMPDSRPIRRIDRPRARSVRIACISAIVS